ncbi:hypothetical protein LJR034_005259 [Caballeronia sp. LjRoot34]|uniref:nSTAND3 domain-containing NTPase n=1 Tax=Caballeronia sp. LjRoot34 TaxID=3342325 RepID=UPI003ED017FD
MPVDYPLHTLGWKAFQDLCLAVAQECLQRPVQQFLPSYDGGRDGAFIGTWSDGTSSASSTIQCKFTSIPNKNLALSVLVDELKKVPRLVEKGLAKDYVLITNYSITGETESEIGVALKAAGAESCRVFAAEWLKTEIEKSARLRMLVPRLYGLGDLSNILDARAYEQAQMILSSLGDDLRKLVVTEAHNRSVEAISRHGFVLLLGAPAAGKSTIGASLAVGAADIWGCLTLKPTSAAQLRDRINPHEKQFFWVDDAWGSTQYQSDKIDAWNQILPDIAAAVQRGSKFLITSRSYIWNSAKNDLKVQAFPLLTHSNVTIEVEHLSTDEKAQILYNHLKMGDQSVEFKTSVKPFLPAIAKREDFLPEAARRFGSRLFSDALSLTEDRIMDFFARPAAFLFDTVRTLSSAHKAALSLLFVELGRVDSPVVDGQGVALVRDAFGVTTHEIKSSLNQMNESLTLLAHDEDGPYWRYKHPTISEAIGKLIAQDQELVELYVRGAKADSLVSEVVCPGIEVFGASIVVPASLFDLLVEKLAPLPPYRLRSFIAQRANRSFAGRLVAARSDLVSTLPDFYDPISEDGDTRFMVSLLRFGLLPENARSDFAATICSFAVEKADASLVQDPELREFLTQEQYLSLLQDVKEHVLDNLGRHVDRVRDAWDPSNDPESQFDELKSAIGVFVDAICPDEQDRIGDEASGLISSAQMKLEEDYRQPEEEQAPVAKGEVQGSELAPIFSDVDE